MKKFSNILNESVIPQPKQEFVIIKPGFLSYSTRIIAELTANGFIVLNRAVKKLDRVDAYQLYIMHCTEPFYEDLCDYMTSGFSMGITLINSNHVDLGIIKDKIREEYGIDEMRNVIHSSDSDENVKRESKIYFGSY